MPNPITKAPADSSPNGPRGIIPEVAKNSASNLLGASHERLSFLRSSYQRLRAVTAPRTVRKETFEDAVARLQLSEDQLSVRCGSLVVGSRLSYAAAVALVLITAYYAVGGQLLQVLAGGSLFFFAAVSGLVRSFRAWQIRIRRLAPLQEFMAKPELWIV